jgi:hypothetical protein
VDMAISMCRAARRSEGYRGCSMQPTESHQTFCLYTIAGMICSLCFTLAFFVCFKCAMVSHRQSIRVAEPSPSRKLRYCIQLNVLGLIPGNRLHIYTEYVPSILHIHHKYAPSHPTRPATLKYTNTVRFMFEIRSELLTDAVH